MGIELNPSDYISIASAVAAGLAAIFAWGSSRQAKRQADAVLGDVPPSIGVYQQPLNEYALQATLSVEIVNHNRRPPLIHEIELEYPENVIIFADSESLRDIIGAILDGMKEGPRVQSFEIPLRIRGMGHDSTSNILTLPFRCGWKVGEERCPVNFYVRVRYRQEGDREDVDAYAGIRIFPRNADAAYTD